MRYGYWPLRESGVVNVARCVLGALLALVMNLAFAVFPQPSGTWIQRLDVPTHYDTAQAACEAFLADKRLSPGGTMSLTECTPPPSTSVDGKTVVTRYAQNGSVFDTFTTGLRLYAGLQCPANSTPVTGGCQCNANYDESGGQCVPHVNQCTGQMNKPVTVNWTLGWTRTPDDNDRAWVGGNGISVPPSGAIACVDGCQVGVNLSLAGVPQKSQVAAPNGMYRVTAPFEGVGRGSECTTPTEATDKSAPVPDCPGYVGEINGKLGCYGTAEKPVITREQALPGGATPIAGNPPAGTPATSGSGATGGAGPTPATGNGGNAGGPAAAAVGGKGGSAGGSASGTGTTTNGEGKEEKDPCGAPGQAECNVKVNEKGTPEGAGTTYDTAKAKLDETKTKNDEQLQKAAGTGDKGFFEPIRSMFWAPPVAACQPYTLPSQVGGLQLDACGVVDGVRNAMALVWAGAGLFMCFGMIKRSF